MSRLSPLRLAALSTVAVLLQLGTVTAYEIRVNNIRAGDQSRPAVALCGNGTVVAVWGSSFGDGSGWGVFARRFTAAGDPLAEQTLVNSYTQGNQFVPDVCCDSSGGHVVVWTGEGLDDDRGVFGRRFASDGTPLDSDFMVNQATDHFQSSPSIACDPSGAFVVAWYEQDPNYAIEARLFDSTGSPLDDEVQVFFMGNNGHNYLNGPRVDMEPGGRFVVAWDWNQSFDINDAYSEIAYALFATDGSPLSQYTEVCTPYPEWCGGSSVSVDSSGIILVWTWDDYVTYQVKGQRFSIDGADLGPVMLEPDSDAGGCDVSKDSGFVVVWQDRRVISSQPIMARTFDASGAPLGNKYVVNTVPADTFQEPGVAAAGADAYVVVWQGPDGDEDGIYASFVGFLLFGDGFESGDTSAWSLSDRLHRAAPGPR